MPPLIACVQVYNFEFERPAVRDLPPEWKAWWGTQVEVDGWKLSEAERLHTVAILMGVRLASTFMDRASSVAVAGRMSAFTVRAPRDRHFSFGIKKEDVAAMAVGRAASASSSRACGNTAYRSTSNTPPRRTSNWCRGGSHRTMRRRPDDLSNAFVLNTSALVDERFGWRYLCEAPAVNEPARFTETR